MSNLLLQDGSGDVQLQDGSGGVKLQADDGSIEPSSITSTLAFGTANVIGPIVPNSIASGLTFGEPEVGLNEIFPDSIVGAVSFGTPTVVGPILPTGIASTLAFGTATILRDQGDWAPLACLDTPEPFPDGALVSIGRGITGMIEMGDGLILATTPGMRGRVIASPDWFHTYQTVYDLSRDFDREFEFVDVYRVTDDIALVSGYQTNSALVTMKAWRTADRGVTWDVVFDPGGAVAGVMGAAVDGATVWFYTRDHTTGSHKVWKSLDSGATWAQVGTVASGFSHRGAFARNSTTGSLYAGMGTDLYKSTDDGANWSINFAFTGATGRAGKILYAPDWTAMFATVRAGVGITTGHIWMSTNDGTSWTKVFDQAASIVLDMAYVNNRIYALTHGGDLWSSLDGVTWTLEVDGIFRIDRINNGGHAVLLSVAGQHYFVGDQTCVWSHENFDYQPQALLPYTEVCGYPLRINPRRVPTC
jgi:hypothetical protein